MRPEYLLAALLALSSLCCAPELDPDACGDATPDGPLELSLVPEAALDSAPPVLHLRARSRAGPLDPASVWLVEGDVGSGHLDQLARDAPSTALLDRFVPTSRWQDDDAVWLAPEIALDFGARYSVATAHESALALDIIAEDALPMLRLTWPPLGKSADAVHGVWCGEVLPALSPASVQLGPDGATGRLTHGALPDGRGSRCVRLDVDIGSASDASPGWAPPPVVIGAEGAALARLEPVALSRGAEPVPVSPLPCAPGDVVVGPGCARVLDDRMWLSTPATPLLWVMSDGVGLDAVAASAGDVLLVSPLPPSSAIWLEVAIVDTSGSVASTGVSIVTAAPMAHLVITEVLANPVGPEPEQEWVEIFNDGAAPASLEGWSLEDTAGGELLPAALLPAGKHALIVQDDYDAQNPYDPAPPTGVLLLRVTHVGKNGLSNEGEPLTLRAPDGQVASRFPPLPKPKSARSVRRLHPKAGDDDPTAFELSAENASTPGAP